MELLRERLAGCERFHPRLGFKLIDPTDKGYVDAGDLASFLNNKIDASSLELFLKSRSKRGNKMAYFEYVRMHVVSCDW